MKYPGPRKCLILETNGRGHRSWFVRLLVQESRHRTPPRMPTIVTTAEVLTTDAWLEHLQSFRPAFDLVVARRPLFRVARRILCSPNYLVVPDGDKWMPGLCILSLWMRRSLVGSVLILRPTPVHSAKSRLAALTKRSLRRVLARWSPDMTVFELVAAPTNSNSNILLDPIAFAPAVVDREAWMIRHKLARSSRVALVIGDISERKCVAELAEAARLSDLPGLVLVAVGRPTPAIRSVFALAHSVGDKRVCLLENFISDQEFDTWIAVADAVCIIHRNEGSSGVLLKAWAAGTPVLVGGASSVVQAARTLGAARIEAPSLHPEVLVHQIEKAVSTQRSHVAVNEWESRAVQFTDAMLGP
jgi:glycosyltransferase involved in cell wall biosynthesis